MEIKNLIDEDFIQYRKPSMFIGMPHCSFKCDKECGHNVCQNSELALAPTVEIDDEEIIQRYITNPITEAIVFGGLEPFDSFDELCHFLGSFENYYKRGHIHTKEERPDIVIYTGYYPEEIKGKLYKLWLFYGRDNIIIKFGRFIPDSLPIHDELLGVNLASCNQKAMRLEDFINENNN